MPSFKRTLLSVLCHFVLNFSAYASPLSVRQADGSQTLKTVTTEMTPDGPVTAKCTIVLTPVTDENGQPAVQEVKTCDLILSASPSQPTATAAPIETSSQSSPVTKSNAESTADSTTSNATPAATASTTASAAPSGGSAAISAHPVSTVTVSTSSASSSTSGGAVSAQPVFTSTTNTATSASTSASPPSGTTSNTAATAAANASGASSTTSAANGTASGTNAAADSSTAAVSLPGKKLSVLPIGLGVFAGISVIALIVVGLVTYERRKYRKAFRERKLAESGAAMGYGGMAR